jgi:microcystin-dependent protein
MRCFLSLAALAASFALAAPQAAAEPYPYLGRIQLTASNFCPRGWAPANGQLISIGHRNLFAVIGTIYGGDGRHTFALPDLRGRTMIGSGTGPNLPPRRIGESGGVGAIDLDVAHMPSHTHRVIGSTGVPATGSPLGAAFPTSPNANRPIYTSSSENTVGMANGVLGHSGAVPARLDLAQPSLGLMHCIAILGEFPNRTGEEEDAQ